MSDNYTLIHSHTEVSLSDSCTNYKDYVDKAVSLGQKAIAFTEHGNTFNWIDKKMYCDKNGIKYIHGVEIYLTRTLDEKIRDNYHTILLAKNYEGFKEINTLVDLSTTPSHMYYKNRITFQEFLNISNNVIKVSACLASPLNKLGDEDGYYDLLASHYDFYEIQPHVNSEDQKEYNERLVKLSKKKNKPLVVGTDTHSIDTYKAECRAIRQLAKKIDYAEEDEFDLTYKTFDEIISMFKAQDVVSMSEVYKAIENTNKIADSVENFELDMSFKYPNLYKNDLEMFDDMLNKKFEYKIKNSIISEEHIEKFKKAIYEERNVFIKLDMVGFMLFMSEMLSWCRGNNIPYGFCRGSVGGSRVAYVLDIIDVNPEVWGTVFSRFANESRKEIGDIDLDFAPSQRHLVYEYIINRFTNEKTAYILAIGTVAEKGTIDEIGRALHNSWMKKNKKEGITEKQYEQDSPYHVKKVDKIKKEYEEFPALTREKYKDIFYYFDGLVNTAVSQSMHTAGIVASPVTLTDNYGTFWNDGQRILSINMEEIHEVSLVKYDILGLKNIEIIKDCREYADKKYPLSHEVNWKDKNVWEDMITSNVGVFQFEGEYAYKLLKQYKPTQINDMSVVNAALRPSGETYRDKLIAREFNKNPSKEIDELLKDNNGFLIFQEDTIKFLTDICEFSGGEADNVRRAIGRKDEERLKLALPQILEGYCSKSSQPRDVAESEAKLFLDIIESSSRYQFGLNHSTGYSMIGYVCAHDRLYYPLEFIAAYLNNANNEGDLQDGTTLAAFKGVKIHPIKFRFSRSKYTIDRDSYAIYKGLSSVKYMSAESADALYSLRDKKYDSFTDFLVDTTTLPVDTRQMSILIKLDFFTEFGEAKKLDDIFYLFYNKKQYSKSTARFKDTTFDIELLRRHSGKESKAQFGEVDFVGVIKEIEAQTPNSDFTVEEKIAWQMEYTGSVTYTNPRLDKRRVLVTNLDVKYSPKFTAYCLNNGKTETIKIKRKPKRKFAGEVYFEDKPFKDGDILYLSKLERKPRQKKVEDEWIQTGESDWWATKYEIVEE
jgi:DNA polymerase-3 subunit alpha